MALQSKAIKISDGAYTAIRKEIAIRLHTPNTRIKFKDVASDLIIAGFNKKKEKINFEREVIDYIVTLKSWPADKLDTIDLIAHIIFWDHIKLALSKGFDATSSQEHVHEFLTNLENKFNVIAIIDNYLKSF